MQYTKFLLERIRGIRQFQPSVIRNSIVMWFLQLISLLGFIGCIAGGITVVSDSVKNPKATDSMLIGLLLSVALLLLLVMRLAKMVRRRNAYILELNEVLDEEEEQLQRQQEQEDLRSRNSRLYG